MRSITFHVEVAVPDELRTHEIRELGDRLISALRSSRPALKLAADLEGDPTVVISRRGFTESILFRLMRSQLWAGLEGKEILSRYTAALDEARELDAGRVALDRGGWEDDERPVKP